MNTPSDLDLLQRELASLAARKSEAIKELDALSAEEQRLESAMAVLRVVRAKHGAELSANATASAVVTATLTVAERPKPAEQDDAGKPGTVETMLRDVVASGGAQGATSSALFAAVKKLRPISDATLSSSLSRLVRKKQIRRDGKLYFPAPTH